MESELFNKNGPPKCFVQHAVQFLLLIPLANTFIQFPIHVRVLIIIKSTCSFILFFFHLLAAKWWAPTCSESESSTSTSTIASSTGDHFFLSISFSVQLTSVSLITQLALFCFFKNLLLGARIGYPVACFSFFCDHFLEHPNYQ